MAISANVMNIETTESGTKVITLSLPDFCHTITVPENYIDGLPVIAAQPYGVIMVEDGAADDMPVVCMNNNKEFFSIALSDLMAADVHDTISFATPYVFPEDIDPSKYLAGLADVQITDPQNGQALIYDATAEKWVNGAGGGGAGYTEDTTTYIPLQTITLTYDESEGALLGIVPLGEMPATAGEYKIQFNNVEYTGLLVVDVADDVSYYDFTYQTDNESIRLIYPDYNDEPNILLTHWMDEELPESETVTFSMIETEIEVSDGFKKAVQSTGAITATMLYYVGDGTGTGSDPKNLALTPDGEPLTVDELNNLWFNSIPFVNLNGNIHMLQLAEKSSTEILFSFFYTDYDSVNQSFDVMSSEFFGVKLA